MHDRRPAHELATAEVVRRTGVTSRALRHYHRIGLLVPARVGEGGMRWYGSDELVRLQRILVLRELQVPLARIGELLDDDPDPAAALRAHAEELGRERDRLARMIEAVTATADRIERGAPLMNDTMFDGFDHREHEAEVTERWGADTWREGDRWWRGLDDDGRRGFDAEHEAIVDAWAAVRAAGAAPDAPDAQAVAHRHRAWISAGWQGREVPAAALRSLADMYTADPRFAANYERDGIALADYVRDALHALADELEA
ncbi:MAG: MerR family transcriptional regulator [Microbacteriaceae bacterium]|nr:MerR family transcriptional regulator [Microbacteriaceae bacterium]